MTAYATLAQLKAYLEITGSNADALLTSALDDASAIIDTQTHRTFVSTVDETHKHNAIADVDAGARRLWLRGDLAVLTSITNGDGANVPLSAIVTEPSIGTPYYAIVLKSNSGLAWAYSGAPEDAIGVTGRWAYSVAPPLPIVRATLRLAAWLYRQPANAMDLDRAVIVGNATIAPAALPADLYRILAPFVKRL